MEWTYSNPWQPQKTMWILYSTNEAFTDLSSDEMTYLGRVDLGLFSSEEAAKTWLRKNRDLTGFSESGGGRELWRMTKVTQFYKHSFIVEEIDVLD